MNTFNSLFPDHNIEQYFQFSTNHYTLNTNIEWTLLYMIILNIILTYYINIYTLTYYTNK